MPAGSVGILGGTRGRHLELAAVQLGHKRMTTSDEHCNERHMDDLKKAAEVIEKAFGTSFARIERVMKKMACNSAAYSAALNCGGRI